MKRRIIRRPGRGDRLRARARRIEAELAAATLLRLAAGEAPVISADVDELVEVTSDQDAAAVALVAAVGEPPPGVTWSEWLAAPWSTSNAIIRDEARAYAAAAADVIEAWGQPTVDLIAKNGDRAVEYAIAQAPDVAQAVATSYEILKPVRDDLERAMDRGLKESEKARRDLIGLAFLGVAAVAFLGVGVAGVAGAYAIGPGSAGPILRSAARV